VSAYVNFQDIAAIPTEYMGTLFRSRLEARWAVFFDFMGIKWQYEPQCFEKEYEQVIKYLPDFYLPQFDCWAEVKGTQNNLNADWDSKMKHILDYHPSPIYNSVGSEKGFIVLGSLPVYNKYVFALPSFTVVQHREGLWGGYCAFFPRYCNLDSPSLAILYDEFFMYGSDEYPVLENKWLDIHKNYEILENKLSIFHNNFNARTYIYICESVQNCFNIAQRWEF